MDAIDQVAWEYSLLQFPSRLRPLANPRSVDLCVTDEKPAKYL